MEFFAAYLYFSVLRQTGYLPGHASSPRGECHEPSFNSLTTLTLTPAK